MSRGAINKLLFATAFATVVDGVGVKGAKVTRVVSLQRASVCYVMKLCLRRFLSFDFV